MKRKTLATFTIVLALTLAACGDDEGTDPNPDPNPDANRDAGQTPDANTDAGQSPDASTDAGQLQPPYSLSEFALPGDQYFPEGIAVTDDGTFFVGSLSDGTIARLVPGTDAAEVFVAAGTVSASAVGMIADESAGVLWLCDAGGIGGGGSSALVGISLTDGSQLARHPMIGDTSICNDITLDDAGNVYFTDSFQPHILRVAAADKLTDNQAAVWAINDDWAVGANQFGLNGIDIADGTIYAAHTQNNAVYRIPIAGDGSAGTIVQLNLDRTPAGLDGLKVMADGSLLFVEGFANQLTRIVLGDGDSGTLSTVLGDLNDPTTFAVFADSAWVVEGQIGFLFGLSEGEPSLPFQVVRVPLDAALVSASSR